MISIITPVFNGESHIEACLKNVIEQACPDLEHIVVDGKSDDDTVKIIAKYADRYPHIRWISEKDSGQSNAMNKGIALAKGEIIAILNVDDSYEPGVLNRVLEIISGLEGPSLIVGNCNVFDDEGKLLYVNKPSRLSLTDLLMGWSVHPHPVNPSAYFYHKSLHDIIGPYDEKNHFTMDLDFILNAVRIADIRYFDEIWGNYRVLEETKTAKDQQSGKAIERYNDILSSCLKKNPLAFQLKIHAFRTLIFFRKIIRKSLFRVLNVFTSPML